MKIKQNSFTLIEVLIFLSIFALFFIVTASTVVLILNHMKLQEHKILAVKYAQDLLEWLRGEKEEDWLKFVSNGDSTGVTYCFSQTTWPPSGLCDKYRYLNPPIYKREVTLINNNADPNQTTSVEVKINVSWIENNKVYQVPINTIFTIWE